ncbi:MAG: hypothetical protein GXY47_00110 [Acidobacteria bacterium]|nr:hypothetical protein [Acidobacteriota bacterium]
MIIISRISRISRFLIALILTLSPLPAAAEEGPEETAPLSLRIGGAEFTPGGFIDMSAVWRSTNVGSGVATAFGSIPANNSLAGRMSEFRMSATNTRLTLKVTEEPLEKLKFTGYVEVDFAGTAPGTAYVSSNSLGFRMRQAFVTAETGKWEILGGQAWSLMTPNRRGISAAPADIFLGIGQDSSYLAGLLWARQAQARVTYHFSPNWALAFSAENPDQYVTAGTTLPAAFRSQFDAPSGNGTIANPRPDFAAKLAFDVRPAGRSVHVELAGMSRAFRTVDASLEKRTAHGVGGSLNLFVEPLPNLRWILTTFFSSGGGRYVMAMGPDAVVAPDGSISPVHTTSGVTGFEYQPRPSSQLFAYYSGAYFSRNVVADGEGAIGFGHPGSPDTANRQIQEATGGYIHTLFKNPNHGALVVLGQYAYVTRAPWYRAPSDSSDRHMHMVFGGVRFTLP